MKALSVRQPWASLLVMKHPRNDRRPIKDIENRKWRPRTLQMPFECLIHASQTFEENDFPIIRERCAKLGIEVPDPELLPRGAYIGQVTIFNVVTASASPWFVGPFGFEIIDPLPFIRPIPAAGLPGFWDVDAEFADDIQNL